MYWALLAIGVGTGLATLMCAAGWIGPREPDRTAEVLRQDSEWIERVRKLVEDGQDGQSGDA